MKRTHGLLIIAIIAFSMAACSDSGGDHDHKWTAWAVIEEETPCIEERECLRCWASEYRHIDAGCEGSYFLLYSVGAVYSNSGYNSAVACIPDEKGGSPVIGINDNVFINNYNLRSVRIGENVKYIGNGAFYQTALKSIAIPASVEYIRGDAFAFCEDLTTVTFGQGSVLESIGDYAFYISGLKSITIPANVIEIGDYAFKDCYDLTTVTVLAEEPPELGGGAVFDDCTALTAIRVPAASVDDYKTANNWIAYADKIVAIP